MDVLGEHLAGERGGGEVGAATSCGGSIASIGHPFGRTCTAALHSMDRPGRGRIGEIAGRGAIGKRI